MTFKQFVVHTLRRGTRPAGCYCAGDSGTATLEVYVYPLAS